MKKMRILWIALAGLVTASCANPIEETLPLSNKAVKVSFKAQQVDEEGTKTVRNADKTVSWLPGEMINVFCGTDKGMFTSTNTEPAAVVSFTGDLLESTVNAINAGTNDPIWALYPYYLVATFDGTSVTTYLTDIQQAVAGTFKDDLFITLAKSDNFNLSFYNVCSGFKFSVNKPGITSIVFRGKNDEDIAGDIKISFGEDGKPKVDEVKNGKKAIMLVPDGDAFEVGKDYYFVMLPTTFSKGFTVTFETQSETGIFNYAKDVLFPRSKFVTKSSIDADVVFGPKVASIVVNPHEMVMPYNGYSGFGVDVWANIEYDVIMPEGVSWLKHTCMPSCEEPYHGFSTEPNFSYDDREARVIFKGKSCDIADTLIVKQMQMKGIVLPESYCTIDNSEQDVTVKVLSNVDYTVDIIDGSDWVSKVTTKSLVEESNLFHVTANPTNEYRTATIEFKSGKLTRQYFINQTPFPPGNVPFEDSNFKKYCVTYYDVNKDGEISFEEASWITDIGISTMDISSVKGIEYMPNLKKLACQGSNGWDEESQESFGLGKLTSIDVSHNPELTFLDVDCNQLTSIDVSNNLALTTLFLGFNKLTSIDISHNTALTKFSCYVNKVASLDLSHNPLLEELYCGHNQLQVLDVSSNPLLKKVECDYNMLSSLDISHNPLLVRVECYENQLTQIIMTSSTNLEYFDCMFNKLLALDVSKNTGLNNLRCSHNNLQILDVSNNLNLTNLECGNNANGIIIWLKTGQVISSFSHDGSADLKYKD